MQHNSFNRDIKQKRFKALGDKFEVHHRQFSSYIRILMVVVV